MGHLFRQWTQAYNNAGSRTGVLVIFLNPVILIMQTWILSVNITLLLTVLKSNFGGAVETKVFLASLMYIECVE